MGGLLEPDPHLWSDVGFKGGVVRLLEPGYLKTSFLYNDVFSIELELTTGAVKPEGGKSSALYQNPASPYF